MLRNVIMVCWFIILLFFSNASVAAPAFKCSSITLKTQNNDIIIPGVDDPHSSQIYFLQNKSQQSLWLDHPVDHPSASAGWSSYSRPGRWSALLLNRKNFVISCAVIQPGKVEYQDCAKAVTICVPEKASFDSKRKGSYWLVEDKSWDDLLKGLEKRGVKLK